MMRNVMVNKCQECMRTKSLQSCPILCSPMDCSPSSLLCHGILQAKILEWVARSSSRGSSQPRDQIHIFYVSYMAGGYFTTDHLGSPKVDGVNKYYRIPYIIES